MSHAEDQAGRAYWDSVWEDAELPEPIDHLDRHYRNHVNRAFAAYMDRSLRHLPRGARLLEIGCARSQWLPYFARRYGFEVSGLDYSRPGCDAEEEILRRAGVSGEIVNADLFDPPDHMREGFDAVVSLGVVEHFDDTAGCLRAIARFAKPEGMILTTIPNLAGLLGRLQRRADPEVFAIHVPLTAPALEDAHHRAGLEDVSSDYLVSTNFGVLNLHGRPDDARRRQLGFGLLQLTRVSKLIWMIEDRTRELPAGRALGGYAACTARRPLVS